MYSGVARSSYRQHCWSGRGHLSHEVRKGTPQRERSGIGRGTPQSANQLTAEGEEGGKGSLMREQVFTYSKNVKCQTAGNQTCPNVLHDLYWLNCGQKYLQVLRYISSYHPAYQSVGPSCILRLIDQYVVLYQQTLSKLCQRSASQVPCRPGR